MPVVDAGELNAFEHAIEIFEGLPARPQSIEGIEYAAASVESEASEARPILL